jgi:hypothetical protein
MKNNYKIKDNVVEMEIVFKDEILTTVFNVEFIPVLEYLDRKWCGMKSYSKSRNVYATAKYKGKRIWLHQVICGKKKGLVIDHINQNSLDNRKENLRNVTHRDNLLNSHRAK